MSDPALFVFIRDGEKRAFGDRWAGASLEREIFFGPDALEKWAIQLHQEDEEMLEEFETGVVVDFDNATMKWAGCGENLAVPAVRKIFDDLLKSNWKNFEVTYSEDGLFGSNVEASLADSFLSCRPESLAEAARSYDDDNEEEDDDEDEFDDDTDDDDETFDEDESRAWITIIDKKKKLRQRHLEDLPVTILSPGNDFAQQLAGLPPAEIPPEKVVSEGLWIDIPNHTLGVWGGSELKSQLESLRTGWKGWNVVWADGGYEAHCQQTGVAGLPISNFEALAEFLPGVLSTTKLDLQSFMGAIGGGIKKKAIQATGCLLGLICVPILIFGFFSQQWKAVGITILVVCLLAAIIFKAVEYKIKNKFKKLPLPQDGPEKGLDPVAGPLNESDRESCVSELLERAGLPALKDVKARFPEQFSNELGI